jgi:RNA polymerase sigma factor for flagellar operon FliA
VLDELRRNDWAPRSLRRWDRDISKAHEQFIGLYGRKPSNAELSESLGISVGDLVTRQEEIARSHVGSLNTVVLAEDDTTIERIDTLQSDDIDADPEIAAMRTDAKERFRAAFDRLPPRDRKVAVLLYVYNLTLREIGEILGVTESRVCQIHGQITKKLRQELDVDEQLFSEVA